ncbi:SHIRT domain-containing protein [Streptococcus pneumoniae]|uniref:SHIRT domain-containing protein n=1 Tax=Streptococcus pneumoniae TaxID=1313 RepID=UPI0001DF76D8|nr:SHIRT domain-containing protein [Streptococcus pneumoniae]EFL68052.1 Fibril-like structure subunit FibA, putative [Streptococcus pneumoniae SP14-BS292]
MFFQDRKIKYSIRKLSVATVSLAIGFLFAPAALGVAQVAQADELSTTEQVENKAENQVSVVSFATEQEESETTYVDTTNKVTWTFAGYDKEKIVVGKGRQTFLGSWVPTPNPEYVFKSSKAGVPLPQSILGMLPKDEASYKVGDTIVAKQPAVESVVEEEKDYVWTFKGYDQKNATYNGKRVTFTGIWEVTPRPHHVSYTFVSVTSGVDLPKFIQKKAPKDGSTYFNRTRVFAEEPTTKTYIDSVNDGTWTFKGYDAASAVVNKANVEFVGKWTFEANKYQATYRFESATSDKALPAGIATLLPSDSATYENGNSVSAKQPAQATYIDSVNDGTWTFKGYDAASAVVNKANVEFVGKWEFKANPTNAETYSPHVTEETIIVGRTPDLTHNVTKLPNHPAGTNAVDITPASHIDTAKHGTYTGKGRVDYPDGSSTEVSVSVNVLPAPETHTYKVTYRFESATSDKALPAGIATLLPSDSATYENGNSVSAKQPAQATYIDSVNDGTWTFKGYDAASAVVNKANVEFVGKWEFKVNPTNAETYTPQVTEETIKVGQTPDLTDNVTNLPNLPAGTKVVDITPAGQIDTTKPGTYTGKVRVDYPDGSSTEVSVSVNVLPAPETQTYKVTYRFESATADNNLPAEVLSLLPQSGTYTTSSSVAIAFVPEAPMPVEVAVANGTWTFLGYQEVEEGSNLTFVGKWVFEAKQDPSPQPQPAPTPQPAPQPNPVPPVNPGGEQGTDNNQADRHQSEQPRKPEENPPAQGPAGEKEKQATLPNAGSTAPLSLTGLVTSSLLAGLAVLLLGRKRKDD